MTATLTDAGTCRHCGWTLRATTLLDDNDQPVDRYLGIDPGGALDGTCWSAASALYPCGACGGTGAEGGDLDADWDCEACMGSGKVADHAPA